MIKSQCTKNKEMLWIPQYKELKILISGVTHLILTVEPKGMNENV
jgi:hypothetical protein